MTKQTKQTYAKRLDKGPRQKPTAPAFTSISSPYARVTKRKPK